MPRTRFLLPTVFALAALSACASDQPAPEPQHHHHHHDGAGPPSPDAAAAPDRNGGLFISPLGQPFRAPAGEPYPSALWFQTVNTTHDGKLTRAQFRAEAAAF